LRGRFAAGKEEEERGGEGVKERGSKGEEGKEHPCC